MYFFFSTCSFLTQLFAGNPLYMYGEDDSLIRVLLSHTYEPARCKYFSSKKYSDNPEDSQRAFQNLKRCTWYILYFISILQDNNQIWQLRQPTFPHTLYSLQLSSYPPLHHWWLGAPKGSSATSTSSTSDSSVLELSLGR